MKKVCNNLETEWTVRNVHVLEIQSEARIILESRVARGVPKHDLFLLAELMIDLIKRFD